MKTEEELNAGIPIITMTIGNKFPELSKYIEELPVDISLNGSSAENIRILQDYYDTLDALLKIIQQLITVQQNRIFIARK